MEHSRGAGAVATMWLHKSEPTSLPIQKHSHHWAGQPVCADGGVATHCLFSVSCQAGDCWVGLCAFSCLCARCRGRSCNQCTQPKSEIFCIDICFSTALLYLVGARPAAAKTDPLQAPALQTSLEYPFKSAMCWTQGILKARGCRPACCQGFDLHHSAFKRSMA